MQQRKGRRTVLNVMQQIEHEAGFVSKPCVLCLAHRRHAVTERRTEFAGLTHSRRAALTCSECGFEREVDGHAARLMIESAARSSSTIETAVVDGPRPAGSEWLSAERDLALMA
jgi:hypothetical protein